MIDFQNVSKSYGTQDVLRESSFRIQAGERVGIVGPNGAGKSTLFALLTGAITPDCGAVSIPHDARIGHMRQQLRPDEVATTLLEYAEDALPELHDLLAKIHQLEHEFPQLAHRDRDDALRVLGDCQTEFEHLGGYELRHRAEAALGGLGFATEDFQRPFADFSGGWQMRAELARVLVSRPDILLLDEPTNFLDVPAVEWLHDYLGTFAGTLLLISHDRYLLNTLAGVTLEVMQHRVTRYNGNYDHYVDARRERYEQLLAAHRNQQQRRGQIERFVERFRAKNTKASQVQSRLKMLDRMEEIEIPAHVIRPPKIDLPSPSRCGAYVMTLENAGASYAPAQWVFRHVDLTLERGEKVAVIGPNGRGKTTLLRALADKLDLAEGRRQPGHNVQIGYQSQDFTDTMRPDFTVFETILKAAPQKNGTTVRNLLGGFGFHGDAVDKPVSVLSGGEKMRLGLARLLVNPPNFLILDEPTTHLDIAAREALQEALRHFDGTICFVSHDVEFVRAVATTVLALEPGGVKRYYGGYDYYREKIEEERIAVAQTERSEETRTAAVPGTREDRKARKRQEADARRELARRRKPLEKKMTSAERHLETLEEERDMLLQQLESSEGQLNYARTNRRLQEIQEQIEKMTRTWEDAALAVEALQEELN